MQPGSAPGCTTTFTMRKNPFSSSTGTKILIAVTGLAIFAFLVTHLIGNALVFAGRETFNTYAHTLGSGFLVYVIDLILLFLFGAHIYKTVSNFLANRKAKPVPYHQPRWAGKPSRKSLASTTMIVTGTITLVFLVLHLMHFKFGAYYEVAGHQGMRDLYETEIQLFRSPVWVGFYVVSMAVIGFHLWHGFWSAFQSLGVGDTRASARLAQVGKAVAVVIAGGFLLIPVYLFVKGGTP